MYYMIIIRQLLKKIYIIELCFFLYIFGSKILLIRFNKEDKSIFLKKVCRYERLVIFKYEGKLGKFKGKLCLSFIFQVFSILIFEGIVKKFQRLRKCFNINVIKFKMIKGINVNICNIGNGILKCVYIINIYKQ